MSRVGLIRAFGTLTLAVLAGCLLPMSSGQQPLHQMYHRAWTARDGAPNNINQVVQAPDGFLWLTTEDGLFRFDGVTFSRFLSTDGTALLSNRIQDMLIAPDGAVWVSYPAGGVSRIRSNKVTNFTEQDGLRGSRFTTLALGKDGTLWITGSKGVEYIKNLKVHIFQDHSGFSDVGGQSIVVDQSGNIWINPASRLLVLPYGASTFVPAAGSGFFGCNAARVEGVLCRSTRKPLTHFTLAAGKVVSRPLAFPPSNYWNTLSAKDGSIWIATDRNGIERLPLGLDGTKKATRPEFFSRGDGLTSDRAFVVEQDHEGSVWVVTDRGLDQFRETPFHSLELDAPVLTLPSNDVGTPFLIGTNRLAALTPKGVRNLSPAGTIPGAAGAVHKMDDGSVWAWIGNEMLRYHHGVIERFNLPAPAQFGSVQAITEDRQHNVWVSSTKSGIVSWDGKRWRRQDHLDGVPDGTPSAMLRDSRGDLWLGFRQGVCARIASGNLQIYRGSSGPDVGDIRTLTDHDGQIWIGGQHGVTVYQQGRFQNLVLQSDQALNDVSGLVFSQGGDLWINSSSGVFRIARSELPQLGWDKDRSVAWRRFDYLDGIDGMPGTSSGNPSAAVAADGTIYLATNRRLNWIDPAHLPFNAVALMPSVTGVRALGRAFDVARNTIHLPENVRDLDISYTAPSLVLPERVRFRYRLSGFEKDWIDAGSRRNAYYARLPPGRYTFEVMACNDSGVWSAKSATVSLFVAPTLTETIWFKLTLVVTAAFLVLILSKARVNWAKRRIAHQMFEILSERQRIARDLHDTLLQGVQALMFKVAVATTKLPASEPMRTVLESTVQQSDQILLEGRKLIANLRTEGESAEALLASLRAVGEELKLDHPDTAFTAELLAVDRVLGSVVVSELRRIGREGLTNAFRHACASHISLTLHATPRELRLEIADNGRGIENEVLTKGFRSGHWGLRNMRERTERLGGRFKITSVPGTGTDVQVHLPALVAYQDSPRSKVERLYRRTLQRSRRAGVGD